MNSQAVSSGSAEFNANGNSAKQEENRLGYSVDDSVSILVEEDGYVDITIPKTEIAPYEHILEVEVPLKDGSKMHVTDYASAGKPWTQESKMAAWMLVK